MAIFGAPLAHEDHALRACYAARRTGRTHEARAAALTAAVAEFSRMQMTRWRERSERARAEID